MIIFSFASIHRHPSQIVLQEFKSKFKISSSIEYEISRSRPISYCQMVRSFEDFKEPDLIHYSGSVLASEKEFNSSSFTRLISLTTLCCAHGLESKPKWRFTSQYRRITKGDSPVNTEAALSPFSCFA